jgi:ribosomal protein S27AE
MIEVELSETTPVQFYGEDTDEELLAFVRLCPNCGRFVKTDDSSTEVGEQPNATCSKCGRVRMMSAGWWPKDD